MERGRRSQQSDDRRGTSLLIQQLAAARERKLQGISSSRSRAVDLLVDSETEERSSEGSASDGFQESGSPTASATTDARISGLPLPQHSRLVRRDKQQASASDAASTDAVGDLSGMLQGMDLAASSRAEQEQRQDEYRFPSSRLDDSISSNNLHKRSGGVWQTGSSSGPQQHAVDVLHQQNLSVAGSAIVSNSRHGAAPAVAADSSTSTDEDDDDSYLTHIQRSKTSAAAASGSCAGGNSSNSFSKQQTSSSTHPQHPTAVVSSSGDDGGTDSDGNDVTLSNTRSLGPRSSIPSSSSSTNSSRRPSSNGIRPYLDQQQPSAPARPAEGSLLLEGGFCLDGKIASKLYSHQIQGVTWLWSLHRYVAAGLTSRQARLHLHGDCVLNVQVLLPSPFSLSAGLSQHTAHLLFSAEAGNQRALPAYTAEECPAAVIAECVRAMSLHLT